MSHNFYFFKLIFNGVHGDFFPIIFLLILRDVHILHPKLIHFLVLLYPPSNLITSPKRKQKIKN